MCEISIFLNYTYQVLDTYKENEGELRLKQNHKHDMTCIRAILRMKREATNSLLITYTFYA